MPLNAEIYYRQSHEGDNELAPVFLIHGAGGTHLHWPAQIRRLTGQRVYAIDLPGHGKSGGRGNQTIESYCHSIIRWMESIHIFRGVFVGHSMGGAIALTMAQQFPERVVALGLIGSGARLRVSPIILENSSSPTTFPIAIKFIMDKAFGLQTDPRLKELAAQRMETIRPSVLHGDFQACNNFDMMESASNIRFPTLIICGQDDQLTPVRYSQYLADQIPKAQVRIIPEAGHMVMLEQPQAVAAELSTFLTTLIYSPGQIDEGNI
ncbi:alpha/beta fold hydrolase [Chloroflexota bacterium]